MTSSPEFNQDTGRATTATRSGPVFDTDPGRPAHVLPAFEDHQRSTGDQGNIVDLIGLFPGEADIELVATRSRDLVRPADL
ncbi:MULTISPECIES: type II toxin-antitoxin system Phd/YefM family antitoxin [unclassified Micromonospora]|uniref:type II toxin-antitoxin system Phd/YefM family antitoxin n=1 Tax=unclassified Micromonospora TaxID=2617518 RepID=UPI003A877C4A